MDHACPAESEVPGMTQPITTREFALYSFGGPGPRPGTGPGAGPGRERPGREPFSSVRYSRYKYGSVTATETFARALGAAFRDHCPEIVRAPRLLMTSSPYTYVPTAATTLARRMRPVLDAARARYGLSPVP